MYIPLFLFLNFYLMDRETYFKRQLYSWAIKIKPELNPVLHSIFFILSHHRQHRSVLLQHEQFFY